jgi:hypothetical protein
VKVDDLSHRVERLDMLCRGLAQEITFVRRDDDPMLYAERKTYLTTLSNVLSGIQEARVTLAKACQRLNGLP